MSDPFRSILFNRKQDYATNLRAETLESVAVLTFQLVFAPHWTSCRRLASWNILRVLHFQFDLEKRKKTVHQWRRIDDLWVEEWSDLCLLLLSVSIFLKTSSNRFSWSIIYWTNSWKLRLSVPSFLLLPINFCKNVKKFQFWPSNPSWTSSGKDWINRLYRVALMVLSVTAPQPYSSVLTTQRNALGTNTLRLKCYTDSGTLGTTTVHSTATKSVSVRYENLPVHEQDGFVDNLTLCSARIEQLDRWHLSFRRSWRPTSWRDHDTVPGPWS